MAVPSAPTALANHPANTCLDLEPEVDSNPTGTAHTITATVRTIAGAGQGSFGTCTGPAPTFSGGTVNIDFEVSGPGDPNEDGPTPETPDLTCNVGAQLGASCTVSYTSTRASRTATDVPEQEAGADEIRGWIDHDGGDPAQGRLVEADRVENQDESIPGTGCTYTPPETPGAPEPDCTDVVTKTWTASRVDCEPETASNPTGEEHTITCTATDEEGNPVEGTEIDGESTGTNDAEQTGPDYSCTTGADGECEFTHTGNGAGTTTYRFWVDDDGDDANTTEGDPAEAQGDNDTDDTDVVTKNWTASRLNCEPETATNRSGDPHEITCTATDANGQAVPGTEVDAEATGANDPDAGDNPPPDYSCTTGQDGTCTLQPTHTGTQSGETTYRAWIDDDGDDDNVDEGDLSEEQCAAAGEQTPNCTVPSGGAGDNAEPDDTDVVTKTWIAAAGATLDCDDQSGDDRESNPGSAGARSNETYLCTVRDVSGNLATGEVVRGEVRGPPDGTGVNDPDNPDSTSYDTPDDSCTTRSDDDDTAADEEGTCEIVVEQADGELGTTEICFWIGAVTDGATVCDEANEPTDEPEGNDQADQVEKTWFQQTPSTAARLDCTPETDTNPAGTSHTITCIVTTATGARVGNAEVDAEATGANDPDSDDPAPPGGSPESPDFNCVTAPQDDPNTPGDQTGTCQFTHGETGPNHAGTTPAAGTTTYRAWIDYDNNDGTVEADRAEGRCSGAGGDEQGCGAPAPGTGCLTPPIPGEPDCTDVMEKTWGASRLECTPETATNRTGDTHTVRCTARDENGNPVSGGRVHAEAVGAGDPDDGDSPQSPDFTCTPRSDDVTTPENETGTCEFTHTSPEGGTTTYRAWMDDDNDAATPDNDASEGPDAGASPDEREGGPNAPGGEEEPDDTDVVTKRWTASRLDCTPETDTNPPGRAHTITCTATDEEGNGVGGTRIQGEATGAGDPDNGSTPPPDFTCTTAEQDDPATPADETESCQFTHTSDESGQTTYRFWVDDDENRDDFDADATEQQCAVNNENGGGCTPGNNAAGAEGEPDTTDVVTKTWAVTLDCSPETDTNPTGQPHRITCTVHAVGAPNDRVGGATVDAEAVGAGDPDDGDNPPPDFTCTTASQDDPNQEGDQTGTCSFEHTSPESGETTYRAWVDDDDDDDNVDEADENETAGQTDGDDTDVVTKRWTASRLNCEPETATNRSGETHRITCTTTDEQGNRTGGTRVDAEATGAGDPDDGDSPPPDFTCTTAEEDDPDQSGDQTGTCSFEHTSDEAGQTTYRAWIDDDEQADNVDEGDADEPAGEDDNDDTDVVRKTWAATRLDCEPETATNPVGTQHTITCTARDAGGRPAGGQTVAFEMSGANDPDGDAPPADNWCTTTSLDNPDTPGDETGTCSLTHLGANESGVTTYRAWIEEDGDPATSEADENEDRCAAESEGCTPPEGGEGDTEEPDNTDVVSKTWTATVDCRPETATNATGSPHTVTCRAGSSTGQAIQGVNIDAEATGDNDPDGGGGGGGNSPQSPDFTCTTGSNGECSFTHGPGGQGTTGSTGQTTYRAWADDDGDGSFDGDASEGPADEDQDDTDVVTKTWAGPGLDCSPEQATNPTGTTHQITCTARDGSSQPLPNRRIDVEATGANDPDSGDSPNSPDFTCNTGQDGTCTVTHSGNTNSTGTTLYRAWIASGNPGQSGPDQAETREQNDNDDTDVVEKRWGPGRLDCTPETDMNPTGTSHQVACTVRDGNNQTASGANVDVEATGANDPDGGNTPQTPDFTCTTDGNGGCSFTHGGTGGGSTAGAGTTTYRAWVDLDGNNATPEADVGENLDEGGNGAGSTNEPDHTDVVQKIWTAGALDCTPETAQNPTGTSHTITCTARDSSGNVVPGTEIDAEVTGANDRDSSGDLTNPDFSCTTSAAGSCTFTHGGGGNNGSSDATGTSTYRAWIDADSSNATAEGDATESRDESGAGAGGTADPDATDVVEKTWVTQPRTISCTPATATNPAGTQHTVTCTVRDRSSQPLAGRAVTLSSTGTGTLSSQSQQTTNNAGQVQATTTSTEEGTQSITATLGDDLQGNEPNDVDECDRAAGDPAGSPAGQCSATVTKTWIAPLAQAANLTVTPAEATNEVGDDHTLTATVTDANGSPMEGAPVTWTSTGVGEIEESDATTDANGVAMAVISSEEAGDQLVSVSTSPCAQGGDCTDTALKHWTTGPCTITGTEAGERLTGTNGDDVICGLGGNDTINGRGGNDVILGQGGNDRMSGNGGRDRLRGGGGADIVVGGAGRDTVGGSRGNDAVRGSGGPDVVLGNGGKDRVSGGAGNDRVSGGGGNDRVRGDRGNDRLDGGRGFDRCNGGPGRDDEQGCER